MRYVQVMKVTGEYLGEVFELIDQSNDPIVLVFPFVQFEFDSDLVVCADDNFELDADNLPTGKVFCTKMRSAKVKTAFTWDEMQAANTAVGVYPNVVTSGDSLDADRASVSFSLYLLGYRDILIDVNDEASGYTAMIDKLNALGVFADTTRYEQVKKGILIS